jgi:hypothetical protein
MVKLLIGCPTSEHKSYCLDRYAESLKSFSDCDVLLVDNSKGKDYFNKIKGMNIPVIKGPWFEGARDRIIASRNILRGKVLDEDYDYLFSLEQDVIANKDDLIKLLSHGKKIVSGVVYNNLPFKDKIKKIAMLFVEHPLDHTGLTYLDPDKVDFCRIKGSGLGCILIHRSVLKNIEFRYKGDAFDDMMFSKDCNDLGFQMYADTAVRPLHLHGSWEGIKK